MDTQSAVVRTVDPGVDARWDDFVRSSPRASVYHLAAWAEILAGPFRARPRYLALERNGALRGVLPIMKTRGLVTGARLRSLPAVPVGGPVAETREDELELLRAACELAKRDGVELMSVQTRQSGYASDLPQLTPTPKHPAWVTLLPEDPEELRMSWKKKSKNLFRNLKKAEQSGATVRQSAERDDLGAFYRLYLRTMRRRRSLPRSLLQLELDRRLLGPAGHYRLFLVERGNEVVAAGLFHAFGDTVNLLYNGSDERHLGMRPNHSLYWTVIRWAIENGYRRFDWGHAVEGRPLASFKAQWSAEPVPEYRYDFAVDGQAARADQLRRGHDALGKQSQGRREALLRAAWERAPLSVTRLAGEVVYRYL